MLIPKLGISYTIMIIIWIDSCPDWGPYYHACHDIFFSIFSGVGVCSLFSDLNCQNLLNLTESSTIFILRSDGCTNYLMSLLLQHSPLHDARDDDARDDDARGR